MFWLLSHNFNVDNIIYTPILICQGAVPPETPLCGGALGEHPRYATKYIIGKFSIKHMYNKNKYLS